MKLLIKHINTRLSRPSRPKCTETPVLSKFARMAARQRLSYVCRQISGRIPEPLIVKVGANDGVTGDPLSRFFQNNVRWRGLLIEPVPYCFAELGRNFPDSERFVLEQVAIGPHSGPTPMYFLDGSACISLPDLPPWFDQLGSFDVNHLVLQLGPRIKPWVRVFEVEVVPLDYLIKRHGIDEIHILHIDVEGFDDLALATLDLGATPTAVIYIEHKHLGAERREVLLRKLRNANYRVQDCGGDYLAIHESHLERALKGSRLP